MATHLEAKLRNPHSLEAQLPVGNPQLETHLESHLEGVHLPHWAGQYLASQTCLVGLCPSLPPWSRVERGFTGGFSRSGACLQAWSSVRAAALDLSQVTTAAQVTTVKQKASVHPEKAAMTASGVSLSSNKGLRLSASATTFFFPGALTNGNLEKTQST